MRNALEISKKDARKIMTTLKKKTTSNKSSPKKMPLWGWILSIFLLVSVTAAVTLIRLNPEQKNEQFLPAEITVKQAKERFDDGTFLLDVRTPEEWNEMHVEGAVLIPLDELPNRLAEVPKDGPVMVICRSGNRSQAGRDILKNAGFQQVTSVAGGINQWSGAGYPTVSGP
jgi:rhodanese-related sulfurtransferase